MIFTNALRMVVDLSLYFFFAELVAAPLGGKVMLPELLLLALCYGVLAVFRASGRHRMFLLLPALIFLLPETFGLSLINRVILAVPVFYIIYLVFKESCTLSWERQADLFSISWKIFVGTGFLLCLTGNYEAFANRSLPVAFLSLVSSVLLLRMLRHEPEVYLNRQFQIKNLLLFGGVLCAAWLASRKFVLGFLSALAGFIYMHTIVPVFTFLFSCFASILRWIAPLFSGMKLEGLKFEGNDLTASEEVNPFSDLDQIIYKDSTKIFFTAIAVLLLIAAAFFLFRWLIAKNDKDGTETNEWNVQRSFTGGKGHHKPEYETGTVLQIRRQYRKFLKWYQIQGQQIQLSDTSADIAENIKKNFPAKQTFMDKEYLTTEQISVLMQEMREIYIRARYDQQGLRNDLKRMKQINKMLQDIS